MNCTGMIFRLEVSCYVGKRGEIVETKKMLLMKKLSCKGGCRPNPYHCDCDWLPSHLHEMAGYDMISMPDGKYVGGSLFKLTYSADEGGVDDIWFQKFTPPSAAN